MFLRVFTYFFFAALFNATRRHFVNVPARGRVFHDTPFLKNQEAHPHRRVIFCKIHRLVWDTGESLREEKNSTHFQLYHGFSSSRKCNKVSECSNDKLSIVREFSYFPRRKVSRIIYKSSIFPCHSQFARCAAWQIKNSSLSFETPFCLALLNRVSRTFYPPY